MNLATQGRLSGRCANPRTGRGSARIRRYVEGEPCGGASGEPQRPALRKGVARGRLAGELGPPFIALQKPNNSLFIGYSADMSRWFF